MVINEVFKVQYIPVGRYLNWLDTHDKIILSRAPRVLLDSSHNSHQKALLECEENIAG